MFPIILILCYFSHVLQQPRHFSSKPNNSFCTLFLPSSWNNINKCNFLLFLYSNLLFLMLAVCMTIAVLSTQLLLLPAACVVHSSFVWLHWWWLVMLLLRTKQKFNEVFLLMLFRICYLISIAVSLLVKIMKIAVYDSIHR